MSSVGSAGPTGPTRTEVLAQLALGVNNRPLSLNGAEQRRLNDASPPGASIQLMEDLRQSAAALGSIAQHVGESHEPDAREPRSDGSHSPSSSVQVQQSAVDSTDSFGLGNSAPNSSDLGVFRSPRVGEDPGLEAFSAAEAPLPSASPAPLVSEPSSSAAANTGTKGDSVASTITLNPSLDPRAAAVFDQYPAPGHMVARTPGNNVARSDLTSASALLAPPANTADSFGGNGSSPLEERHASSGGRPRSNRSVAGATHPTSAQDAGASRPTWTLRLAALIGMGSLLACGLSFFPTVAAQIAAGGISLQAFSAFTGVLGGVLLGGSIRNFSSVDERTGAAAQRAVQGVGERVTEPGEKRASGHSAVGSSSTDAVAATNSQAKGLFASKMFKAFVAIAILGSAVAVACYFSPAALALVSGSASTAAKFIAENGGATIATGAARLFSAAKVFVIDQAAALNMPLSDTAATAVVAGGSLLGLSSIVYAVAKLGKLCFTRASAGAPKKADSAEPEASKTVPAAHPWKKTVGAAVVVAAALALVAGGYYYPEALVSLQGAVVSAYTFMMANGGSAVASLAADAFGSMKIFVIEQFAVSDAVATGVAATVSGLGVVGLTMGGAAVARKAAQKAAQWMSSKKASVEKKSSGKKETAPQASGSASERAQSEPVAETAHKTLKNVGRALLIGAGLAGLIVFTGSFFPVGAAFLTTAGLPSEQLWLVRGITGAVALVAASPVISAVVKKAIVLGQGYIKSLEKRFASKKNAKPEAEGSGSSGQQAAESSNAPKTPSKIMKGLKSAGKVMKPIAVGILMISLLSSGLAMITTSFGAALGVGLADAVAGTGLGLTVAPEAAQVGIGAGLLVCAKVVAYLWPKFREDDSLGGDKKPLSTAVPAPEETGSSSAGGAGGEEQSPTTTQGDKERQMNASRRPQQQETPQQEAAEARAGGRRRQQEAEAPAGSPQAAAGSKQPAAE